MDRFNHLQFKIPNYKVGKLIGPKGITILEIEKKAAVKIFLKQEDAQMFSEDKTVEVVGIKKNCEYAKELILKLIDDEDLKITIPKKVVPVVIGKGGNMIKKIKDDFGAHVQILNVKTSDESPDDNVCVVSGLPEQIQAASTFINDLIQSVLSAAKIQGVDATGTKRPLDDLPETGIPESKKLAISDDKGIFKELATSHTKRYTEQIIVEEWKVPDKMTGLIIGYAGNKIKELQAQSGCKVQIAADSKGLPERICTLTGTRQSIEKAKELLTTIINRGCSSLQAVKTHSTTVVMIPGAKIDLVVGEQTIRNLQERAAVKMEIVQERPQQTTQDMMLRITGESDKCAFAKQLVMDLISEKELESITRENFDGPNEYGSAASGGPRPGGGNTLEVDFPKNSEYSYRPRQSDSNQRFNKPNTTFDPCLLRIRGLPFSSTEEDIRKFFKGSNIIHNGVKFMYTTEGKKNGTAYIRFLSEEDANLALKKDKEYLGHRFIEVYSVRKGEFEWNLKLTEEEKGKKYITIQDLRNFFHSNFTKMENDTIVSNPNLEVNQYGVTSQISARDSSSTKGNVSSIKEFCNVGSESPMYAASYSHMYGSETPQYINSASAPFYIDSASAHSFGTPSPSSTPDLVIDIAILDWQVPDIEVIVKDSFEDFGTGVVGQTGVIRGINSNGICAVYLCEEEKIVLVHGDDLKPVIPEIGDKVKVLIGPDKERIGKFLYFDEDVQCVVKINKTVKLFPISYIGKYRII